MQFVAATQQAYHAARRKTKAGFKSNRRDEGKKVNTKTAEQISFAGDSKREVCKRTTGDDGQQKTQQLPGEFDR